MARSKREDDTGSDAQKQMDSAKRYFDSIWRQKYDCAMDDWIVNMSKNPQQLRLLACFATPNVCELRGKMLVFKDNLLARQAKELWQSNFITTLQDLGLSIYKEPPEKPPKKWHEMDDRRKMGFAKAIWMKRGLTHFDYSIQSVLCRVSEAPRPEDLKELLKSTGIDIESLVA